MKHLVEKRLDQSASSPVSVGDDDDSAFFYARYPHYTLRRTDPKLRAPAHDVDWWRVAEPRKGFLHRLLGLFKR